ncbi:MAG: hypothetical protein C6Y22_01170 [Hapalosiphonaceae cyanobacterium JJU2]|nr:MAG: hypothetical protein C6Y22_01170 [Hapalosiphonaceae cyanobacterium JJU2]
MYDLAVFIYDQTDETEANAIGQYRAKFGVVPRVGDYIYRHIGIEGAIDCQVIKVAIVPKLDESATDADAIIKAIRVEPLY